MSNFRKFPSRFETVIGNSTIKDIASLYRVKHKLNGVDKRVYYIIISTILQSKVLKLHINLDQPNPTSQPNGIKELNTKQYRQEPEEQWYILNEPWNDVSVDLEEPHSDYPDCYYNLIIVDNRTRYPEVATINSTAFQPKP